MAPPPARPPLDRIAVYITLFQSSPVSTYRGKILSQRLSLWKVFPKSSWQGPERLWAARWWWSRSLRLGCPRGSSAGRRKTEENVDCQWDDVGDDCPPASPAGRRWRWIGRGGGGETWWMIRRSSVLSQGFAVETNTWKWEVNKNSEKDLNFKTGSELEKAWKLQPSIRALTLQCPLPLT